MDELIEGDELIDFDKLFIAAYTPRSIKDIIFEKGFFHKILPFVWIQESRTGRSSRYWDDEKQEYLLYEEEEE